MSTSLRWDGINSRFLCGDRMIWPDGTLGPVVALPAADRLVLESDLFDHELTKLRGLGFDLDAIHETAAKLDADGGGQPCAIM